MVYLVPPSTFLQLLSVMKSNSQDRPLLLATDKVLLNLHPMMFLLRTDAVAMTTMTIGVEGKKRNSPGAVDCYKANSRCESPFFTAVFTLLKLFPFFIYY